MILGSSLHTAVASLQEQVRQRLLCGHFRLVVVDSSPDKALSL